jgi:prepilin-type N-terminal cleavage/methylation domain-containing protein
MFAHFGLVIAGVAWFVPPFRAHQMHSDDQLRRGTTVSPEGDRGFTLLETLIALAIVAIGFLGALATITHAGRLASAAEEDARAVSSLDQRLDQLRTLEWSEITSATRLPAKIWTARPEAMAGLAVSQETMAVSAYDLTDAKSLLATWDGAAAPTASVSGSGAELSAAKALKIVATLSWMSRSGRPQTRMAVTVISKGGISKSVLP